MNPGDQQQQPHRNMPPAGLVAAMQEARRQQIHVAAQQMRVVEREEEMNNDGEEGEVVEVQGVVQNAHGILRRMAGQERKVKKTRFDESLARKKKFNKRKQESSLRQKQMHDKFESTLLLECMSGLFNDPRLSDVTFKVGPRDFHAHKLILSAWSEVFQSLTDQRWAPSSSGCEHRVLTLNEPEECQQFFEDFLRFMYTEKVELTKINVYPILMLADKYLVHDLCDVCEEYLLAMLDSSTNPWMDAMNANRQVEGLTKVQEKSFSLLESNFHSRYSEDDGKSCFDSLSISRELLVRLLQSSHLVVPSETCVFEMVMHWLKEEKNRLESDEVTDQMLSLIRFEHIPAADLVRLHHFQIPSQTRLQEKVFEALKYRALAGEKSYSGIPREFTEPRIYTEPFFCVRINIRDCRVDGELPFKKLRLFTDDTKFNQFKLQFPVARDSQEKNIYLVKDTWEIGGLALEQEENKWIVRYIIRPLFEDVGRSYRLAILTHDTGVEEEQDLSVPSTCVDQGDVGREITIDLPSTYMEYTRNPQQVWIQVGIYVFGEDKSIK